MANGERFEVVDGPRIPKRGWKWSRAARAKQSRKISEYWAKKRAAKRQTKAAAQIRSEGSYIEEPIKRSLPSATMYLQLGYDDYKQIEEQMKAFKETTHVSTPGPFYHKSIRIKVNDGLVVEFHGPNVRGA